MYQGNGGKVFGSEDTSTGHDQFKKPPSLGALLGVDNADALDNTEWDEFCAAMGWEPTVEPEDGHDENDYDNDVDDDELPEFMRGRFGANWRQSLMNQIESEDGLEFDEEDEDDSYDDDDFEFDDDIMQPDIEPIQDLSALPRRSFAEYRPAVIVFFVTFVVGLAILGIYFAVANSWNPIQQLLPTSTVAPTEVLTQMPMPTVMPTNTPIPTITPDPAVSIAEQAIVAYNEALEGLLAERDELVALIANANADNDDLQAELDLVNDEISQLTEDYNSAVDVRDGLVADINTTNAQSEQLRVSRTTAQAEFAEEQLNSVRRNAVYYSTAFNAVDARGLIVDGLPDGYRYRHLDESLTLVEAGIEFDYCNMTLRFIVEDEDVYVEFIQIGSAEFTKGIDRVLEGERWVFKVLSVVTINESQLSDEVRANIQLNTAFSSRERTFVEVQVDGRSEYCTNNGAAVTSGYTQSIGMARQNEPWINERRWIAHMKVTDLQTE